MSNKNRHLNKTGVAAATAARSVLGSAAQIPERQQAPAIEGVAIAVNEEENLYLPPMETQIAVGAQCDYRCRLANELMHTLCRTVLVKELSDEELANRALDIASAFVKASEERGLMAPNPYTHHDLVEQNVDAQFHGAHIADLKKSLAGGGRH